MQMIAIRLARRVIQWFSSQSRKVGPSHLWSSSQFSSLELLRLKHHSAKMQQMVVGMPGTKMPTMPTPTSTSPNAANPARIRRGVFDRASAVVWATHG